jgi:hypothetical protein
MTNPVTLSQGSVLSKHAAVTATVENGRIHLLEYLEVAGDFASFRSFSTFSRIFLADSFEKVRARI